MFVTNWISTTKIQKISEITNFFRHYFLSRTEVNILVYTAKIGIKNNKTKVLCTYLCTRAGNSFLKERCAGFCFAFTNIQKLVFHGFGGL